MQTILLYPLSLVLFDRTVSDSEFRRVKKRDMKEC